MLPETGKISMADVWRELNPPNPKNCDYYFETREDFDARRDIIIAENNNDLSQKTFGFSDGVTDLSYAFSNTEIISTPKMIFARNTIVFDFVFMICRKLKNISNELFVNCENMIDAYQVFEDCISLTTVPFELFDNCTKAEVFFGTFQRCINITSALPDVWNKQKFTKAYGDDYATGCTKASNYNEIPSNFGGPSSNPAIPLSIKQKGEPINKQSVITKSIERIVDDRLPDGPIALGDVDVRELAGINDGQISLNYLHGKELLPTTPQECDYYFETIEEFVSRYIDILNENKIVLSESPYEIYDLSNKTFGFGDNITHTYESYMENTGLFYPDEIRYFVSTPKMIVAKNLISVKNMFCDIRNLKNISPILFKLCPNIKDFSYCFGKVYTGNSIETVPFNLFDNCPNAIDFSYCFGFCSNITSALPDVWNKNKFPKVTDGTDYALNCTKAANYSQIPSNFK